MRKQTFKALLAIHWHAGGRRYRPVGSGSEAFEDGSKDELCWRAPAAASRAEFSN